MSPFLVVGSVARDTIHNHLGTHEMVLGGSATFASLAGAFFAQPRLVGVVGRDFPETEIELLRTRGVDVRGLQTVDGRTFHWEGRYSPDLTSRETVKTELNCFADFEPVIPESYRDTPYVMLGNIHPTLQVKVVEQMRSPRLVIADTMNFWIDGTPEELREMLGRIDLLVINEEEARQLSGLHHIRPVAHRLLQMGPRLVIIKRGEYGALLFTPNDAFSAPAFPLDEVLDPTGAGDSFAGGLLGYLAREDRTDIATLRRAVIYGSAVASFCVEGVSVERLIEADVRQVEERFREFARLAHFATEEELTT
ncbi:MAG: PfkB family carbohydrate kinase [Sandaracinaceae bacterium]